MVNAVVSSHDEGLGIASELTRWAAECRSAAKAEANTDARTAYAELAVEFEAVGTEIEGLLASLESLKAHAQDPRPKDGTVIVPKR